MRNITLKLFSLVFVLLLQLTACGGGGGGGHGAATTAERQVLPIPVSADVPQINPGDVAQYEEYGYSAWRFGPGLAYEKQTQLAPGYQDAPNAARLLSFFTISDIHISDKESPAQPIFVGLLNGYGSGESSAYSPVILSTTQVLDAAVRTINSLHEKSPFDFGLSLGDAVNNSQYNELRWFVDVIDGQFITPSSGANAGAENIDYQKPFQAAGLNKEIRWYQVIGNHDQYWMGSLYENAKTTSAHVADTILNMNPSNVPNAVNETGAYMGVVDGSTPYGDIIGAGPEDLFPTPPQVVPDPNRRTLATPQSSSLNWMKEFFNTSSNPVGHGFTQANLDRDFACYSFEPKSDMPIKVIVLDDTCKGATQPNYARGCLDQQRLDWLKGELQEGQDNDKLMIIAAHVPVWPQQTLAPGSGNFPLFSSTSLVSDLELLAILHNYPNLMLWLSGHRHLNVVTPQPSADLVNHPEQSFWEVETASLRDQPQEFRTIDIRRNSDNTISIIVTNVDPEVADGSPAAKSRGYAIGAARIYGTYPLTDTASQAYNAELVKQLTPRMQAKIADLGSPLE